MYGYGCSIQLNLDSVYCPLFFAFYRKTSSSKLVDNGESDNLQVPVVTRAGRKDSNTGSVCSDVTSINGESSSVHPVCLIHICYPTSQTHVLLCDFKLLYSLD